MFYVCWQYYIYSPVYMAQEIPLNNGDAKGKIVYSEGEKNKVDLRHSDRKMIRFAFIFN